MRDGRTDDDAGTARSGADYRTRFFRDSWSVLIINARVLNLQERVKGIVGSMDALPFEEEELDLIWSEGAIYNIGFERGLNEWRKYLKTGGYVAVSESSWFTERTSG